MKAGNLDPVRSLFVLIALGTTLATAQVRINEFMARNQTTLPDGDGDYEDWIELHNPTNAAVDLAGWTLTDDVEEPSRWAFPSVSLAAGEYLVVFASGKDRNEANGELHTNFSLSTDGEYLALARPDGTIAQSFAPTYPEQVADISYGQTFTITNETVLLGSGTAARAHVPSSNGLGDSWKQIGFNDNSWASGLLGAGYERSPIGGITYTDLLGLDLEALMFGQNQSAYIRVKFQVTDPLVFRTLILQMRYDDGFAAFLNGVPVAAANAPDTLDYQSAALEHRPGGDAAAVEFEDFDISTRLDALVGRHQRARHPPAQRRPHQLRRALFPAAQGRRGGRHRTQLHEHAHPGSRQLRRQRGQGRRHEVQRGPRLP